MTKENISIPRPHKGRQPYYTPQASMNAQREAMRQRLGSQDEDDLDENMQKRKGALGRKTPLAKMPRGPLSAVVVALISAPNQSPHASAGSRGEKQTAKGTK